MQGRGEHPSQDFLTQLRDWTPWRLAVGGNQQKDGDHLHLGRNAR